MQAAQLAAAAVSDSLRYDEEEDAPDGERAARQEVRLPGPPTDPASAWRTARLISALMARDLADCLAASLDCYARVWTAMDARGRGGAEAWAGAAAADAARDADGGGGGGGGGGRSARAGGACGARGAAWGSDRCAHHPPPLFSVQLVVQDERIAFSPPLAELRAAALSAFDAAPAAAARVEDVAARAADPASEATLRPPPPDHPAIAAPRAAAAGAVDRGLEPPAALAAAFGAFAELLGAGPEERAAAWEAGGHSLEETAAEIERLGALAARVEALSELTVAFRMVSVDAAPARAALAGRALAARGALLARLRERWRAGNEAAISRCEAIADRLAEEPPDAEAMAALAAFASSASDELPALAAAASEAAAVGAVLEAGRGAVDEGGADALWRLRRWPAALEAQLEAAAERLAGYRERFRLQLAADQRALAQDAQTLLSEAAALSSEAGARASEAGGAQSEAGGAQSEERAAAAREVEERLAALERRAQTLSGREDIFGLPHAEHPQLAEARALLAQLGPAPDSPL
ncbi:dynein heavy chain axonemal [Raphidocelis subcapitata]|uniref:Dynein heavy chain axonemal n=1 Tax=Raphidocelis subcapitata TaxID=307507 RepID=A0A2V0NX16_9CHLO|nr:dynein heavy chain axonemal [Raphidocelis subcapitata]|eukprot:GBF91222.1 dynein heavy chain axonemal [Raphidocelis subcapitata]